MPEPKFPTPSIPEAKARLAEASHMELNALGVSTGRVVVAPSDLRAILAHLSRLEIGLTSIGRRARSDGDRTFDDCIRDLAWIDDLYRSLLLEAGVTL